MGKRIQTAIGTAVIGALGAFVIEILDFYAWNWSWFEAETFAELARKAWFLPAGAGLLCGLIGFFKGEDAAA